MSLEIIQFPLWNKFKAKKLRKPERIALARLTTAFGTFRDNAAHLAQETARFIPDLTVHDVTHVDALWEMAELIAGLDYPLNPAELFVLGGAFLLHDSAMSLCAYPLGWPSIRKTTTWQDLWSAYARDRGAPLTPADEEIVLQDFLRQKHAQQAEVLATASWTAPDTGEPHYLIEDSEFRNHYGPLIGRLAHSHWWDHNQLETCLSTTLGASKSVPQQWSVNPIKLAVLLRCADAIHLDARRAPRFLFALRNPQLLSRQHWTFQSRFGKPVLEAGKILFSAGRAFDRSSFDAWWLAFQAAQMAHEEIRFSNNLLSQCKLRVLRASGVHGAESPVEFEKHVPTKGWLPVRIGAQVSNPATIIKYFGGKQIYGDWPDAALRELIQNAADAIRARRALVADFVGKIVVRVTSDESGRTTIAVLDNGIGMSRYVVENVLLDLGHSLWNDTSTLLRELPRLSSAWPGMDGRYGVGFFSVFTLGNDVSVITRRYDQGYEESLTLQFEHGVTGHPILLPTRRADVPPMGGTTVSVILTTAPDDLEAVRLPSYRRRERTDIMGCLREGQHAQAQLELASLCPALDVDLYFSNGSSEVQVIYANDWRTLSPRAMATRCIAGRWVSGLDKWAALAKPIIDADRQAVGRAAICAITFMDAGIVTAGGFLALKTRGFIGILLGDPTRISREDAKPRVSGEQLAEWAQDQADQVLKIAEFSAEERAAAAPLLASFGAQVDDFPLFLHGDEYLTAAEVYDAIREAGHSTMFLCSSIEHDADQDEDVAKFDFEQYFEPAENLVVYREPPSEMFVGRRRYDALLVDLLEAWGFTYQGEQRGQAIGEVNGCDICRDCDVYALVGSKKSGRSRSGKSDRPLKRSKNGEKRRGNERMR